MKFIEKIFASNVTVQMAILNQSSKRFNTVNQNSLWVILLNLVHWKSPVFSYFLQFSC